MSFGSRFYSREGEVIEGLRLARKCSPLPSPSVSTVLKIVSSPALTIYHKRQMYEATLATPRHPDQTDDEHYDQCLARADEHAQRARDTGSNFHDAVQQFHIAMKFGKPIPNPPSELTDQYGLYVDWYQKNVAETLMVEDLVMGPGYAGRVDHVCRLKSGIKATTDVKTQGLKDRGSFNFYSQWSYQLGGYSKPTESDSIISIAVSSGGKPVLEAYEWPRIPAFYCDLFLGLLEAWKHEHNYYP